MRYVSAGLESLLGRARLLCHRWSTAASVHASAAHTYDVHHTCPSCSRLPMPVPYPSRCRCSAKLDEQDE